MENGKVEKEDVHACYTSQLCWFLNIHPSVPGATEASPGKTESISARSDLFGHYPNCAVVGFRDRSRGHVPIGLNLRSGYRSAKLKERTMKNRIFSVSGDGIAKIAALLLCISLTFPGSAQTNLLKVFPVIAVSSSTSQLPKGVKVVARVPLEAMPITGMYTQREYGRTYLYIEHGRQSITTVDVTNKRNPRLVDDEPGKVDPIVYGEPSESGPIEVSHRHVFAGIDSRGGSEMYDVLHSSDPQDAKLLQALGQGNNLADRDSRLVYFASPSQLLIIQDNRWTRVDFTN